MKKLLLTVLLFCACTGTFAQSKLNPTARFMIHQAKMYPSRNSGDARISALVKLQPGEDVSMLANEDVTVLSSRGRFAVITLPLGKAEAVANHPAVQAMSFGQEAQPLMDKARPASFVSTIQQGKTNGFSQNYRGAGILLGMMDQGLDPNHINFYNKDLTENRIIELTTITGTNAATTTYKTPEEIKNFGTENATSTHATHVAGIMGGSYNSTGRVAYISSDKTVLVSTTRKVPYYGVAPEAQMYPCVGSLYNENIVLAAQKFADKATELGKPGVFNLSVGYVPGPHDGTDLINEALAEVGKDIIICVAAGNDGTANISLQNNFATTTELKTILTPSGESSWSGEVDTWSDNSNGFRMAFAMIDKNTGAVTAKVDIPEIMAEGEAFYLSNDNTTGATHNPTFSTSFSSESYVYAVSELNDNNNRFNTTLMLKLSATDNSKVVPALIYTGSGNTVINSYASGGMTFTDNLNGKAVDGFTPGNPNQSINNIACGENIIVVGAYMTRATWPVLSSQLMGYTNYDESQVGGIAPFTSYGNLPDGKTLPEICAPGLGVISSYSNYYVESQGLKSSNIAAEATTTVNSTDPTEGRNNPWGCEAGTSMATPYVTGTVALLLEADRTLKVNDVKSLLTSTAVAQNQTGTVATQWGAGKLNADEAMRKLLGKPSEIGNVNADTNRRFAVSFYPGGVQAVVAGEKSVIAKLYSLAGACVASASGSGDSVNISTESLPKGVYVLTVITSEGVKVSKNLLIN